MLPLKFKTIGTLGLLLGAAAGYLAAQPEIKKVPITPTSATSGATMFFTYCAPCHGPGGKGDGPAAAAIRKPLQDLTLLSKANKGAFPANRVMLTLGRLPSTGPHGSSEMPVWGNLFRGSGQSEAETQFRIYNLTRYIEGLQVGVPKPMKPAEDKKLPLNLSEVRADSGKEMFQLLCAGCHGAQGRGDGPAAATLKGEKLDITRMTQDNNGQFPALRLANILGLSPDVAAHGSKEMPVWGEAFRGVGEQRSIVQLRIKNLVDYIKTLQR